MYATFQIESEKAEYDERGIDTAVVRICDVLALADAARHGWTCHAENRDRAGRLMEGEASYE